MISFRRAYLGLLAAAGAALGSQAPAFSDQYLQSLGGRLDQARLIAARITEAAEDQDLTLEAYIAHFSASPDPVVRSQARLTTAALDDATRLGRLYDRLAQARASLRPLLLLGQLDGPVAAATARRFAPAAPLGLAGLLYGALGAVLTFAGFFGCAAGYGRLRRLRARGATAPGGSHA